MSFRITETRKRATSLLLACVILCFQLSLPVHVYAHTVAGDEVFCQTCLVGHHAASPVAAATTEPFATADMLFQLHVWQAPHLAFISTAHGARAPPSGIQSA